MTGPSRVSRVSVWSVGLVLVWLTMGCGKASEQTERFVSLSPTQTKVDFVNRIAEDDSVNLLVNEYTYMGGGVGVGDFNRDGRADLFFTGNQVSSKLYLNRSAPAKPGDTQTPLRFEDVTRPAGVQTRFWCTGVSVIDINQDGWSDLYVCTAGVGTGSHNLLFINNGKPETGDIPTFTEAAAAYGLADTGFSTQAAFLDYDKDGDLDMFLLRNKVGSENPNDIRPNVPDPADPSADRLYRNEGVLAGRKHPVFRDVSQQAGIRGGGYGLGLAVTDLNQDGWPDLYVGNDYLSNDCLWLNNQDGTFTNTAPQSLRHQSYSTMGVDAADLDNDGRPDLVTLDMLPETNERKKMTYSFMSFERYELERRAGYAPEFMRNMVQLNQGVDGQVRRLQTGLPLFSEIGQAAGLAETDWSWSVLLADYDDDGAKDAYITSGMGRDLINADFVQYRAEAPDDPRLGALGRQRIVRQKLDELGEIHLPNHLYLNQQENGGPTVRFTDATGAIAGAKPSLSNGAAYADLDRDGDLDLIVNNINEPAFILQNTRSRSGTHSVTLRLDGLTPNRQGIGAVVQVYAGGRQQMLEQNPARGFLSTVDEELHVGLGKATRIDSLLVRWPDNRYQRLINLPADSLYTLRQANAQVARPVQPETTQPLLRDVTDELGVQYQHHETFFNDYAFQRLLPRRYSQPGPYLATGDVNGDGRTDFFVGGAYGQPGQLGIQQADGRYVLKPLVNGPKVAEDTGCLLLDTDGDNDLDLLVSSGSVEFAADSPYYQPRLYRNDGQGHFSLDQAAFPPTVSVSAGTVTAADFDKDGDLDLFLGGRLVPTRYPESPRSFLLRNTHGHFEDVTAQLAPELLSPGMVTSAVWTDLNRDTYPDLVIAGEWMPVRFFAQTPQHRFRELSNGQTGLTATAGFWRRLVAADIDGDGDEDILAGNLGENQLLHASAKQPAVLYAGDYDQNGTIDPILCHPVKHPDGTYQLSPALSRNQWAAQSPAIRRQFTDNKSYAQATLETILPASTRTSTRTLRCEETRSGYFENQSNGRFRFHPFPPQTQWAPINALLLTDLTGDGQADLLLAGNDYQTEVESGRQDASYGLLLAGTGRGRFRVVSNQKSGLYLPGEVIDVKAIQTNHGSYVLVATNNDHLRVLKVTVP